MIEVTQNIRSRFPSAFKKARQEKLRAVRLEPDLWYCARRAEGHGKYLVHFHVVPSVNGDDQVNVECHDLDGYKCKGTYQDRLCIHAAKVLLSGMAYGRRKLRTEKAA